MNSFNVLPFYDNLDKQNHRKSYAYNSMYPLIVKNGTFIPFQINLGVATSGTPRVYIVSPDGGQVERTQSFVQAGLRVQISQGRSIITFPGIHQMAPVLEPGRHHIRLEWLGYALYSEEFTVVGSTEDFLSLEWSSLEGLFFPGGWIDYSQGFKHKLYLDAQLGKPEYKFEEEGEVRDGYFFPEKQISEKVYKFTFLAPEYLLDALRIVRLSDEVFVTDKFGTKYRCDTFLMTPTWQTQGNLASVVVEFETDTVVKKVGLGSQEPYTLGDFNEDYNEDYYTQ